MFEKLLTLYSILSVLVVPGGYYLTMQPKWQTVYYYFRRWQKEGVWQKIHDSLRAEVRVSLQEGMSNPLLRSREASAAAPPIPNRFVPGIMDYLKVLMGES